MNKTSRRAPASAHGKQMPRVRAPALVEALRQAPMARSAPMRGVSSMQPQLPGSVQAAGKKRDPADDEAMSGGWG